MRNCPHEPLTEEDTKAGMYASELPLDAKERIDWLMLQPEDCRTEPQPWMQLRDLLERKGDRKGAKYVLFRFRCLQAKQKLFTPLLWLKGLILFVWETAKFLIGDPKKAFRHLWPYLRHPNRSFAIAFAWLGGESLRIGWSIALTLLIGTCIFTWANSNRAMIATALKPNAIKDNGQLKPLSPHYPNSSPSSTRWKTPFR